MPNRAAQDAILQRIADASQRINTASKALAELANSSVDLDRRVYDERRRKVRDEHAARQVEIEGRLADDLEEARLGVTTALERLSDLTGASVGPNLRVSDWEDAVWDEWLEAGDAP